MYYFTLRANGVVQTQKVVVKPYQIHPLYEQHDKTVLLFLDFTDPLVLY